MIGENEETCKTSLLDGVNWSYEGEGAAATQLLRHPDKHWLLVSNDTDAILYALLAGIKRQRNGNLFKAQFWPQLNFTANPQARRNSFRNQFLFLSRVAPIRSFEEVSSGRMGTLSAGFFNKTIAGVKMKIFLLTIFAIALPPKQDGVLKM